jgi:hypothetical protein
MVNEDSVKSAVEKLQVADQAVDKLLKENKSFSWLGPYKSAASAGKSVKAALVILNDTASSLEDRAAKAVLTLATANAVVDELLSKYKSMSSQQLYKDASVAGTAVKEALTLLA